MFNDQGSTGFGMSSVMSKFTPDRRPDAQIPSLLHDMERMPYSQSVTMLVGDAQSLAIMSPTASDPGWQLEGRHARRATDFPRTSPGAGNYGRFTSKCAIIPAAWCSRMWQWYIHMPGLSSGYHAIRAVAFGGTLMTSSSDRQAGFFPLTSRT